MANELDYDWPLVHVVDTYLLSFVSESIRSTFSLVL